MRSRWQQLPEMHDRQSSLTVQHCHLQCLADIRAACSAIGVFSLQVPMSTVCVFAVCALCVRTLDKACGLLLLGLGMSTGSYFICRHIVYKWFAGHTVREGTLTAHSSAG